ncbi:MAG: hypothetical protein ABJB16_09380 [Saprospiraceae bacterium]
MGITIYYSGKLRTMEQLPSLMDEVIQHCNHVKWEYEIIYRSFEIPLQGIAFEPKGSHAVWMTFMDDGLLVAPHDYAIAKDPVRKFKNDYRVDTKTHYVGADVHMQMITFIRYLSDTYFSKFVMYDESEYWQTNNRSTCEREFGIMEQWVRQMINKLDELDGRIGEIGDAGEIVDERIYNLLLQMPPLEVLEHLHTPRPGMEVFSRVWN